MGNKRVAPVSKQFQAAITRGEERWEALKKVPTKSEQQQTSGQLRTTTPQDEKSYEQMTDVERFNRWGIKGLRLHSEAINM